MQSQVSEVSPVIRQLNVTVEGEKVTRELDKAYRKLADTARIKGFRQGKVPRQVLERYYRADVEQDVLGRVISDAYREAVLSNKLEPVANPEIKTGEFVPGQDFQFVAKVEVRPNVKVEVYKGLSATRTRKTITDKDVEDEVAKLREQVSTLAPVTGRDVVEKGDLVNSNFFGTIDDAPFQGGSGSGYVIEVGAGRFFKEVEDALPGKKFGEAFELDVLIPDTFRVEAVRGKTAHFRVTAVDAKTRQMPALDDEFAKDLGEYDSLADMRAKLREKLEKGAAQDADRDVSEQLMTQLIERNPFEVPPSLVERQIDLRVYQVMGRINPEQARRMGLDRSRLREDFRDGAVRQVRGALLLDAVADMEKLDVGENDVQEFIQKVADGTGTPVERVRSQYQGDRLADLKARLRTDKAIDFLLKAANVIDKPA